MVVIYAGFRLAYDSVADTLYVSKLADAQAVTLTPAANYFLDQDHVVLRYQQQRVISLIILGFGTRTPLEVKQCICNYFPEFTAEVFVSSDELTIIAQ